MPELSLWAAGKALKPNDSCTETEQAFCYLKALLGAHILNNTLEWAAPGSPFTFTGSLLTHLHTSDRHQVIKCCMLWYITLLALCCAACVSVWNFLFSTATSNFLYVKDMRMHTEFNKYYAIFMICMMILAGKLCYKVLYQRINTVFMANMELEHADNQLSLV